MQPQHCGEVDLGQDVAVEHDDRVLQRISGVPHGAGGAERHRLDDVAQPDTETLALAEHLFDSTRLIVEAEDDLVDFRHLFEQINLVIQKRTIQDRNDGFRRVDRERPQPGALAAGEQNRFHVSASFYQQAGLKLVDCRVVRSSAATTRDGELSLIRSPQAAMNLPNALTIGRIFLVPLLVVVLLTKFEGRLILGMRKELVGAAIFGLASLTDVLDGYLARRRKQITTLGQLMDPLADKLLITAALVSLVQMDLAPAWMVAVILGREFAVTVLRSIAHARGVVIPASPLGKFKMMSQVVAILLLILGKDHLQQFFWLGTIALWIAVLTAIASGVDYYRQVQPPAEPEASGAAVTVEFGNPVIE